MATLLRISELQVSFSTPTSSSDETAKTTLLFPVESVASIKMLVTVVPAALAAPGMPPLSLRASPLANVPVIPEIVSVPNEPLSSIASIVAVAPEVPPVKIFPALNSAVCKS